MPGARLTSRSADAQRGIWLRLVSGPPGRPALPLGSHRGPGAVRRGPDSTRRDLGALATCRALPASADCASPGAGVTLDHPLLLSRCCQGRIRASGPIARHRSQGLGFEGEVVEPTSGIEPLTCSLRAGCGVIPPPSTSVHRRMPGKCLGRSGIPSLTANVHHYPSPLLQRCCQAGDRCPA